MVPELHDLKNECEHCTYILKRLYEIVDIIPVKFLEQCPVYCKQLISLSYHQPRNHHHRYQDKIKFKVLNQ